MDRKHLGFGLAIVLGASACGAPRAARIEGDLSAAIERGMTEGGARFDHTTWDRLVHAHARPDGRRFDYAGLETEAAAFDGYLDALAKVDLGSLEKQELKAVFINAYNAFTIRSVLDHVRSGTYDIDSIRDIPDVFGREEHVLGGYRLSLDNIEHNVLRPVFRDPRVHFAVNCASISCPPLPVFAFTGDGLDAELERVTKSTLTNPDYVSVEGEGLLLTKILEWYGADFVTPDYRGSETSLPAYLRKYATDEVRQFIDSHEEDVPIRFRDYDWRLNRPST